MGFTHAHGEGLSRHGKTKRKCTAECACCAQFLKCRRLTASVEVSLSENAAIFHYGNNPFPHTGALDASDAIWRDSPNSFFSFPGHHLYSA